VLKNRGDFTVNPCQCLSMARQSEVVGMTTAPAGTRLLRLAQTRARNCRARRLKKLRFRLTAFGCQLSPPTRLPRWRAPLRPPRSPPPPPVLKNRGDFTVNPCQCLSMARQSEVVGMTTAPAGTRLLRLAQTSARNCRARRLKKLRFRLFCRARRLKKLRFSKRW